MVTICITVLAFRKHSCSCIVPFKTPTAHWIHFKTSRVIQETICTCALVQWACSRRYSRCKLGTKNGLIFHSSAAANIVSLLKYAVLPAAAGECTVIVEYTASFNPSYIFGNVRECSQDLQAVCGYETWPRAWRWFNSRLSSTPDFLMPRINYNKAAAS